MDIRIDSLRPGDGAAASTAPAPAGATSFEAALALARTQRATSYAQPAGTPGEEPSPPAEVLAQTAAAARTWETLQASGREVHFSEDAGGRVGVSMHHVSGERIAVLALNDLYTLIEQEAAR
jgi:hypothetical protein